MKKKILFVTLLLAVTFSTFAGGILTNTNQHVSFLRMPARGASISIDGVYSNPAGLGFMDDGLHLSFNWQSAYQKRIVDASFALFDTDPKRYEGKASAPFIPSFQALYKMGDWAFSGSFAVTGGGGKASFDQGLAMFSAPVMAGLAAAGINSTMYDISSAMDGTQIIYGVQLGASYRINEYFSAFLGGRMNYVSGGYQGYLNVNLKPEYVGAIPPEYLPKIELDCEQTGWGVTPILSFHAKYNRWNLGLKYEFMTNLNIENKTKANSDPEGALKDYANGVNTPHDIPALLSAAIGCDILPTLRASFEYHMFFDKDAEMANNRQKHLDHNTNEYLAGIEWDAHKYVTLSGGIQFTDMGPTDDFQSDIAYSLDSYSIGLGAAINITPKLTVNVAYFWTNYDDYTKTSTNYNNTTMPGTDVLSRTNKVFGLGVDYRF